MQPVSQVNLFPTCIVDLVEPRVGLAAALILERMGHDVEVPDAATCCGQPAWNAGEPRAAAAVARVTLRALAETDGDIVVPSGSCTTMVRVFWQELFDLQGSTSDMELVNEVAPRTFELSEYLAAHGPPPGRLQDQAPMVYHRSCHMQRELGIVEQPEALLDEYQADRRTTDSAGRCCGFGGLFSVKLPETSVAMADEILDEVSASGAGEVVGCDASCLMHLRGRAERRGLELGFAHLAEVVERALVNPP